MRILRLRHNNQGDIDSLYQYFRRGYKVTHATPIKDCIYYILDLDEQE